jgi:hypothetical protein
MKRRNKVIAAVSIGIAVITAGLWSWWITAAFRGRTVARFDVWRGHFEVQTYGLPVEWLPEYQRLLRERYGIQLRPVAGCIVPEELVAYVDAYDSILSNAIEKKFGAGTLKRTMQDAERLPDESRQAQQSAE